MHQSALAQVRAFRAFVWAHALNALRVFRPCALVQAPEHRPNPKSGLRGKNTERDLVHGSLVRALTARCRVLLVAWGISWLLTVLILALDLAEPAPAPVPKGQGSFISMAPGPRVRAAWSCLSEPSGRVATCSTYNAQILCWPESSGIHGKERAKSDAMTRSDNKRAPPVLRARVQPSNNPQYRTQMPHE